LAITVFFRNGQTIKLDASNVRHVIFHSGSTGGGSNAILCYAERGSGETEEGRFLLSEISGYAIGKVEEVTPASTPRRQRK
jgi:hypothetical protein